MVKCDICHENLDTTFLQKVIGTMIKVEKKKRYVCFSCQRKYPRKEDLLKQLS